MATQSDASHSDWLRGITAAVALCDWLPTKQAPYTADLNDEKAFLH